MVCVHACMCVCKQLPGNQSFDSQISAHEKGGGARAMDLDRQLLTSLFSDINWGPLEHVSHGPQLMSGNINVCACVCVCVCVCAWVQAGHIDHRCSNMS